MIVTAKSADKAGWVEELFALEADLRAAACNYADWMRALTSEVTPKVTPKDLNASRGRLRAAALAYAACVNKVER